MSANTNYPDNLEYIQELLSPYLDDEVSEEERVLVEEALAASAELRQELELLRQTVTMVKTLPPVPAPRPFTLSEADVQPAAPVRKKRSWLPPLPGWAGGLAMAATTLICVLAAGGLLFSTQFSSGNLAPAEIARQESTTSQAAEAEMAAPQEAPAADEAAVAGEEKAQEEAAAPVQEPVEEVQTVEIEKDVALVEESEEGGAAIEQAEIAESEAPDQRDADVGAAGAGEQATVTLQMTAPAPTPTPAAQPTTAPQEAAALAEEPSAEEEADGEEGLAAAAQEESAADTSPDDAAKEPAEEAMIAEAEETEVVEETVPSAAESEEEQELALKEEDTQQEATATASPLPTASPSPTPQPTLAPQPTETAGPATVSPRLRWVIVGVILATLAVLAIVGILIWANLSKRA